MGFAAAQFIIVCIVALLFSTTVRNLATTVSVISPPLSSLPHRHIATDITTTAPRHHHRITLVLALTRTPFQLLLKMDDLETDERVLSWFLVIADVGIVSLIFWLGAKYRHFDNEVEVAKKKTSARGISRETSRGAKPHKRGRTGFGQQDVSTRGTTRKAKPQAIAPAPPQVP